MKNFLFAAVILGFSMPAYAQSIETGSRVVIKSNWHSASGYRPKIVECNSNSGMCLRDTRSQPANKKMVRSGGGLKVTFKKEKVVYIFKRNGRGDFTNLQGKKIGTFTWSQ